MLTQLLRNKGIISANGVKFENGKCIFIDNTTQINYSTFKATQQHSVRFIGSFKSFGGYICGLGGHQYWLSIISSTLIINNPFNNQTSFTLPFPLLPNTNYEIIAVEDATKMYIYINGNLVASSACVYNPVSNIRAKLAVNGRSFGDASHMKTTYELLEIYNKALSASEVKLLYQQRLYTTPIELPLLLDFDSTRGIIEDRTGMNTLIPTNVNIQKIGKVYSAYFNGTNATITSSNIITSKLVSFWINSTKFNTDIIKLTSTIWLSSNSSGVLQLNGTTGTVYINGILSTQLLNKKYCLVTIKFNSNITINVLNIGFKSTYFKGFIPKLQIFQGIPSSPNAFAAQKFNNEKIMFGL